MAPAGSALRALSAGAVTVCARPGGVQAVQGQGGNAGSGNILREDAEQVSSVSSACVHPHACMRARAQTHAQAARAHPRADACMCPCTCACAFAQTGNGRLRVDEVPHVHGTSHLRQHQPTCLPPLHMPPSSASAKWPMYTCVCVCVCVCVALI